MFDAAFPARFVWIRLLDSTAQLQIPWPSISVIFTKETIEKTLTTKKIPTINLQRLDQFRIESNELDFCVE